MNCGCTDGKSHSKECIAEHVAAAAGGDFVKWLPIEGCPKDGSVFYAWDSDLGFPVYDMRFTNGKLISGRTAWSGNASHYMLRPAPPPSPNQ
jgi:hypothetical protein